MKPGKFLLFFLLLLILSCTDDDFSSNCVKGSGTIVSETRSLSNFQKISNTTYADILLTQGPQKDITLEAQANVLQELKTTVVNGELIIDTDRCFNVSQKIVIKISIPEISGITLTGVGNIIAQNEFQLTDLNLILTGVGDIYLMGTTNILDISLTGAGNVHAFDLTSNTCNTEITGVGNVETFVNDALNVTITGTGNVSYKGTPTINSTITGVGQVLNAN